MFVLITWNIENDYQINQLITYYITALANGFRLGELNLEALEY